MSDTEALKALVADASALQKQIDDGDGAYPQDYHDIFGKLEAALPALERMLASQTQTAGQDMVLVPKQITPDIGRAIYAAWDAFGEDATMGPVEAVAIYKAMLSAAPVASQMGEPAAGMDAEAATMEILAGDLCDPKHTGWSMNSSVPKATLIERIAAIIRKHQGKQSAEPVACCLTGYSLPDGQLRCSLECYSDEVLGKALKASCDAEGKPCTPEYLALALPRFKTALSTLLRCAYPVAPGMGWQPIETAPKDGTEILIAGGTFYYDACMDTSPSPFTGVTLARWDYDGWNGGYGSEYDAEYWHEPTVWMPKPSAPLAAAEQGEKQ